jgi:hypothetical protein
MKARISAKGYTNVILVLNMKRFIAEEDQSAFESVRGTEKFKEALRKQLPQMLRSSPLFLQMEEDKKKHGLKDGMSTEDIGFATGVFRSLFIEEYIVPTYVLQKEHVSFPDDLTDNFQFRTLFMRGWQSWKAYIRPTLSGMFVIRLIRQYDTPRELIKITEDLLNLQESLDVQSAYDWLTHKREEFKDQPEQLRRVEKSVKSFLTWLGGNVNSQSELLYNPVQWKIAMEISARFVNTIGSIPIADDKPLRLTVPKPSLSIPLHDSYAVFHIDELFADESVIVRSVDENSSKKPSQSTNSNSKRPRQIPVLPEYIQHSPLIKRALINLIEGEILEREKQSYLAVNTLGSQAKERHYFPPLRWQIIDQTLEQNLASWMEEICLMTARTALIIPSRRAKQDYLLVSTTPGATLRVKYARYWGSIERMIEFVVEIRTLAQLVEKKSYLSLEKLTDVVNDARAKLHSGDIELDEYVPILIKESNNVRRLAAMAQGMSDPLVWSRGEYSIQKARHLLLQLGVPTLLTHIDRNMNGINSLTDRIDDMYVLDLAEKGNDLSVVLTVGLAAISFILTLIMLPSFWTDTQQILFNGKQESPAILSELFSKLNLTILGYFGTGLGILLVALSFILGFMAIRRTREILRILNRAITRLGR